MAAPTLAHCRRTSGPEGKFAKDAFEVDLTHNTVRCPAGALVVIRPSGRDGARLASFGAHCNGCALRGQCIDGKDGRAIRVHPTNDAAAPRIRQRDPARFGAALAFRCFIALERGPRRAGCGHLRDPEPCARRKGWWSSASSVTLRGGPDRSRRGRSFQGC